MISLAPSVLLIATALSGAAEPASTGLQFELTTLSGHRQTGVLTELSSDSATLTTAGKTVKVPLAEVLDIRTLSVKAAASGGDPRRPELALTDGSLVIFKGPLNDNAGKQIIAPGAAMAQTDVGLEKMAYLVEGVKGSMP